MTTLGAVNRGTAVDMRSDVLTKPTPRMLQAMTQASLDDDVFREDRSTLGKLQNKEVLCHNTNQIVLLLLV